MSGEFLLLRLNGHPQVHIYMQADDIEYNNLDDKEKYQFTNKYSNL